MVTCRAAIVRAYQMSGITPSEDEPDAGELTAGMSVLQSIYNRIADTRDYQVFDARGAAIEVLPGQRVMNASAVTLATRVMDDHAGEELPPRDASFLQYSIGAGVLTFASDRGAWVALDDLEHGDEAPFSSRNSEGLSALIAMELAETYPGAAIGPLTAQKARRWQSIFARQAPLDQVEYF